MGLMVSFLFLEFSLIVLSLFLSIYQLKKFPHMVSCNTYAIHAGILFLLLKALHFSITYIKEIG